MEFVKVVLDYNDGSILGIMVDYEDATYILSEWMAQEEDEIEVEGHSLKLKGIKYIKFA